MLSHLFFEMWDGQGKKPDDEYSYSYYSSDEESAKGDKKNKKENEQQKEYAFCAFESPAIHALFQGGA